MCAGVLMVDVSGVSGDLFKGSIMYQNRVWKARKKKKGRGQQRRERGRRRDADGDRKQEEFTKETEENSKHSLALQDITPAHQSVNTFPLFPS